MFNTSWLEDLYEEQQLELTGQRVTPLVCNPGRIMLTSSRLYFQPYNNVEVVRVSGRWWTGDPMFPLCPQRTLS